MALSIPYHVAYLCLHQAEHQIICKMDYINQKQQCTVLSYLLPLFVYIAIWLIHHTFQCLYYTRFYLVFIYFRGLHSYIRWIPAYILIFLHFKYFLFLNKLHHLSVHLFLFAWQMNSIWIITVSFTIFIVYQLAPDFV